MHRISQCCKPEIVDAGRKAETYFIKLQCTSVLQLAPLLSCWWFPAKTALIMAVLFRTCCCGCNLRTGIFLIGLFGLVSKYYINQMNYSRIRHIYLSTSTFPARTFLIQEQKHFSANRGTQFSVRFRGISVRQT